MGRLIHSTICSLDGMYEDAQGDFSWAQPSEELLRFVNEDNAGIRTVLYGRRLWETMRYWETAPTGPETSPAEVDWTHIWRATHKHVFSTTLTEVDTQHTTLHPRFDPDEVRALVDAADTDVTIGGAGLAMVAVEAGLVDEFRLVSLPIVVGAGRSVFPDHRVDLELAEVRPIGATGAVYSRYLARR